MKSKSDGLKLNFAKKDNISKGVSQVKGLTCAGVPEVYLVCFYWGETTQLWALPASHLWS
jgi:hypothetical protein